jgi:Domain of unknown function (DUF4266)
MTLRTLTLGLAALLASSTLACVTVKPQQRAILADPAMVFGGDPQATSPIRHVYQNREGSFGGDGVSGGGCGCN